MNRVLDMMALVAPDFPTGSIASVLLAFIFAAVGACAATPRMEVGVCAHIAGDEYRNLCTALDRAAEAGFSRVRADFTWSQIEPRPGEWRFKITDLVMDEAEKRGIRILPILCYDNPKAYPGYAWQNPEAWVRFVRTVVARYKNKLDAVEIWNEENIPFWKPKRDPVKYTGFLRLSYRAVKDAAPRVRVAMGGLAGRDYDYLDKMYKAGAANCMDIVCFHPYVWPKPPDGALEEAIRHYRAVMAAHGDADKPIWITEMGWPTHKVQMSGQYAILAGLRIARPNQRTWRMVYAKLAEDRAGEADAALLKSILPPGSTAEAWSPRRLAADLSTNAVDAVMLPPERFPLDALDALRKFVSEGGVLVAVGGVPMYYASRGGKDVGGIDCNEVKRRFHVGWRAWWTDKTLPESLKAFVTDDASAAGYKADPAGYKVERFFTDANLAAGDRMVPMLVGTDKVGNPAVAGAVYLLDSDLKGAIVVSSREFERCEIDEASQAKYLVRAIDIAESEGVESFMIYSLWSYEGDPHFPEHHFGVCHRDYSPKPAFNALKKRASRRRRRHNPLRDRQVETWPHDICSMITGLMRGFFRTSRNVSQSASIQEQGCSRESGI